MVVRESTRRAVLGRRLVLASTAVGALVFAVCWIVSSAQVRRLRGQAANELRHGGNPDDALQRLSQAAALEPARTAFAVLTVATLAVLLAYGLWTVVLARRRRGG